MLKRNTLTILLLILILLVILRPRVKLVKVPIEENYDCLENKMVANPKYETEKKAWTDKCLKHKNGIFATTECSIDAISADLKEPFMIEEKVSAICKRKIGNNNIIKLVLYGEDRSQIVLFSYQSK